jgi:hypothetical protein
MVRVVGKRKRKTNMTLNNCGVLLKPVLLTEL